MSMKLCRNEVRDFDFRATKLLGSYVYCLIDPDNEEVFYVGKGGANGKGNDRLFDHFSEAERLQSVTQQSQKTRRILDIWAKGKDVDWKILRFGLNAKEAHEVATGKTTSISSFQRCVKLFKCIGCRMCFENTLQEASHWVCLNRAT